MEDLSCRVQLGKRVEDFNLEIYEPSRFSFGKMERKSSKSGFRGLKASRLDQSRYASGSKIYSR